MALFTDFFPTAGDQINTNMADQVASSDNATLTPLDLTTGVGTLVFGTALATAVQAGNVVTFTDANSKSHTGVVTSTGGVTNNVAIVVADTAGLLAMNNAVTNVSFTRDGQTVIEGDTVTGGNSHTAGDSTTGGNKTVQGNLTVEGDIDLNGADINIGDDTATLTVDIVGNAVTIGRTETTETVTINGPTKVTNLLNDDATKLIGSNDEDDLLNIALGTGLEFVHDGDAGNASILRVASVGINNTHTYTTATSVTDAATALGHLVSAFNSAGTASGGVTVTNGTVFNQGDLILLTFGAAPNTETESYIFGAADATAGAGAAGSMVASTDFIDITHSGDVVERISATGNNNIIIGGSATVPTISVDLTGSDNGQLLFDNNGTIDGSQISQTTGETITVTGTDTTFNWGDHRSTMGDNEIGFRIIDIAGGGSARAFDDTAIGGTISFAGMETELAFLNGNSYTITRVAENFLFFDGGAGASSIDRTSNTTQGTGSFVSPSGITVAAQTTINSGLTVEGDTLLNGALTVGTFTPGNTDGNVNVQFNALGYNVSSTGANFNDPEGGTAGFNVNSSGNTTIGGNFTQISGTGQTTLGNSSSQTRVNGTGITHPGSGADPLNLVVGENGQLMTVAGTAGFDLFIANDNNTVLTNTVTSGDLVILPVITADRTIYLPASPTAGAFVEISNLSGVGTGSGTFRWHIQQTGETSVMIMGTSLPHSNGGFELDDATASFKLVYTNATYGWVVIGAN